MLTRRRLAYAMSLSFALASFISHACYYDEEDKCGPHMEFNADAHVCLCDSKSVKVAGGCEPCPSGREPVGDKCACPSGTKENEAGECVKISGLGDPCDDSHPCNEAPYDYCAVRGDDGAGTCTKKCSADADCDDAYTCADWETTPYCRQFSGAGTTCSMPGADDPICDGDADYCFMGQCFVRGCKVTADHAKDDCPPDRKCCDVAALNLPGVMTACVPLSSAVCK